MQPRTGLQTRRDWILAGLRLAPAIAWPVDVCAQPSQRPLPQVVGALERAPKDYERWLRRELALPTAVHIDHDLRIALIALIEAHIERMRPVLRAWAAEEFGVVDSLPSLLKAWRRIDARFVNEFALWRLPSPGPEYDAIWLRALQRPAACRSVNDGRLVSTQVAFMQAVPPAERKRLLDGERWLLAQWGRERPDLPQRPSVAQSELVDQATSQIRAGLDLKWPAMPPALAARVLRDSVGPLPPAEMCARDQWGLRLALTQGGSRDAQALVQYRYAVMPTVGAMAPPPPDWLRSVDDAGPSSYPRLATYYGVEGRTTLEVQFDTAGHFVSARVVDRAISVPGIRDSRPVAFETVFDEASLARAAAIAYPGQGSASAPSGDSRGRMDIIWKLPS